jgi:formylglycine-generating enzyme required for sulfatase activity
LPEYWLGVTPVTVAQFQVFVDATHYQTTAEVQGVAWIWNLLAKRWAVGKGAYWRAPQGPGSSVKAKTGHPVTQVSWDDAQAFCRWLSSLSGLTCRLPSEAEWEKAARGTDGRIYPWGNALPDETRCNYGQKVGGTMPCGHYSPRSDAPYGCQDMAGNVWEWTSSLWGNDWGQPDFKYPYQAGDGRENPQSRDRRVLRGGSLHYGVVQMRSACRDRYPPDSRLDDTGFRVCCVGLPGRD